MDYARCLPLNYVLLAAYLIFCAIHETDCSTFHVSFLGRNMPALTGTPTGVLFIKTAGSLPVISHNVSTSCQYSISDWGLDTGFHTVTFDSPECIELVPNGTELASKGIKVESPDNFTLQVIQVDSAGEPGDGYLAIPDEYLGNEYYIITYCSTGGTCQFAVTGIADDTYVTITFPNNIQTSVVCVDGIPLASNASTTTSIPFTINEFDVLHFESEQDLSGTYIQANDNVAVVIGASGVPNENGSVSEIAEQIPPINKWGSEFVVVPNYLNDAGDIVKIVTKTDNTVIYILGFSPFVVPNAGEAVERRIDWQMHSTIHSSNPVLIVQTMNVNLYNASTTTGSAAMVLVQHREQWVDTENYFHCTVSSQNNDSLIAVISDSDTSNIVSVLPSPVVYYSPWNSIDGSGYDAMISKPEDFETAIGGTWTSSYGYCEGQYAMLLGVNWDWDNEDCVMTASSPGDDVDNDCDGQIDEDVCTEADLETDFTSVQNSNGDVTFKTFNVRGAGYVNVTVTTCDIAMLTLKTRTGDNASITVQISPSLIVEQMCIPECFTASSNPISVNNCTVGQHYSIEWFEDGIGLKHVFHTATVEYQWDIDNAFGIVYDELIVSAFAGTADFLVGLPEKDCDKVISGAADTAGIKFVLPVEDTDENFIILLYTKDDLVSALTVELSVEHSLGVLTMGASETVTILKVHIIAPFYSKITLTALGGELSVYLQRSVLGTPTGLSILPVDVLGPSYHMFQDSSIDANNTIAKVCDVFATERTTFSYDWAIPIHGHTELTLGDLHDFDSGLLIADHPVSVFCGTFDDSLVQMPPRETLGTKFFIPKLDLLSIDADAEIHLVMTEDSTVLTIRGEYDQMDPVDFTGDVYIRSIEHDTIYSITASKPVQVHVQVRSSVDDWGSAFVIPPVQQYKSEHVFPGLAPSKFVFMFSSAVDLNGTEVPSLVTQAALIEDTASTFVYSEGPVFSLTVLSRLTVYPYTKFIIASDVRYRDINEVCTLTIGSPGDGIDNDCDGLIDEEHCSDSKEPGTIDFDLDGSLNKDCSADTSATTPTIQLSIPFEMVTCQNNSNATGTGNGGIVIDNTDGESADPNDSVTEPEIPTEEGTEHTYETITSTGVTILFPTTTPPPGATAHPAKCYTYVAVCKWPESRRKICILAALRENQHSAFARLVYLMVLYKKYFFNYNISYCTLTAVFNGKQAPEETCVMECLCPCGWVNPPQNYTEEELEAIIVEIQEKLKVSKAELSATIRKKTSAKDDRPSATAVGYIGLVFMIVTLSAVALLDITSLFRDVRVLMENVREVFQR